MPLIEWNGEEVIKDLMEATRQSIDEITEEAAQDAADNHWWQNRSGNLELQIMNEPAQEVHGHLTGKFGVTKGKGFYGLFLERRNSFLRPAADRLFPTLPKRIKDKF